MYSQVKANEQRKRVNLSTTKIKTLDFCGRHGNTETRLICILNMHANCMTRECSGFPSTLQNLTRIPARPTLLQSRENQ